MKINSNKQQTVHSTEVRHTHTHTHIHTLHLQIHNQTTTGTNAHRHACNDLAMTGKWMTGMCQLPAGRLPKESS